MPLINYLPPFMELLRSQTEHDAFPSSITDSMLSPSGASSEAISQLDAYIRAFFIFDMPKNFYIQLAVAGSWICFLFIIGNSCVLHRIYKGQFWFFKLQRRSEGIYVVPNALNSFMVFVGFFAILWLAFLVIYYEACWRQNPDVQYHIGVFNLIVWWPLYTGAFLAGWGSFYTAPGALEKGPLSKSKLGKLALRPLVINIFCLGTPIVVLASLLSPIIHFQRNYNKAFDGYRSLHADLVAAVAASPDQVVPLAAAQVYLQRASDVWQMQTHAVWHGSIGFGLWSIWAGLLLIFYIPAGGYLCYLLWRQLKAQGALLKEIQVQKEEIGQIDKEKEEEKPSSLLFQPLNIQTLLQHDANQVQVDETVSMPVVHRATEADTLTSCGSPGIPFTVVTKVETRIEDQKESQDSGPEFFFPPISSETKRRTVKRYTTKGSPQSRYNYLRRCFINLSVLYIGVVLGISLYMGVAAALARSYYDSFLHSPSDCRQLVYNAIIVTTWGAVVLGTLTIFAILARFTDPANQSHQEEKEPKKKRHPPFRRFLRRISSDKTVVGGISRMDKAQQTMPDVQQEEIVDINKSPEADPHIIQPAEAHLDPSLELADAFPILPLRSSMSRRVSSLYPESVTQGSVSEDDLQLVPRRKYRSSSLIQSTTHGDMLCPDPQPKPLAPERPPPISLSHLTIPRPAPSPPSRSRGSSRSRFDYSPMSGISQLSEEVVSTPSTAASRHHQLRLVPSHNPFPRTPCPIMKDGNHQTTPWLASIRR